VILFLAEHRNLPSLYVDEEENLDEDQQTPLKPDPKDRFPVLPPVRQPPPELPEDRQKLFDPDEWAQATDGLWYKQQHPHPLDLEALDAYTIARAWYGYAQEALPPPGDLPGSSAPIKARLCERIPTNMAQIIFRSAPALAQNHVAERLQEEGWYDGEPFVPQDWFRDAPGYRDKPVKVGGKVEGWSQLAWAKAYKSWYDFGTANHLRVDDREMERRQAEAKKFREEFHLREGEAPENLDPETFTKEQKRGWEAVLFLLAYETARHHCNFAENLLRASME